MPRDSIRSPEWSWIMMIFVQSSGPSVSSKDFRHRPQRLCMSAAKNPWKSPKWYRFANPTLADVPLSLCFHKSGKKYMHVLSFWRPTGWIRRIHGKLSLEQFLEFQPLKNHPCYRNHCDHPILLLIWLLLKKRYKRQKLKSFQRIAFRTMLIYSHMVRPAPSRSFHCDRPHAA